MFDQKLFGGDVDAIRTKVGVARSCTQPVYSDHPWRLVDGWYVTLMYSGKYK